MTVETASPPPQILARESDGATIAYHKTEGKTPGVVFCTGFMSDMDGGKALALEAYCKDRGQSFLRFDYTGHGQSSGDFEDGTIGQWSDDAVYAIDQLTEGPQVVVGSSMGGWVMMRTALARPEKVGGLVGIAPAPDFTVGFYETEITEAQRTELHEKGVLYIESEYGPDPTPFTLKLIEDGKNQLVLNSPPVPITCPVRLLHGMGDPDVPWRLSLEIAEKLAAEDVVTTLIKDGDHRLSRDQDIDRLLKTVGELLDQLEGD